MIHTGDTYDPKGKVKYAHPLEVDEVAVDFPDVTFVICHLGNPWVTDAMEVIYKNANVVGDISGLTLGHFEERFEQYMLQVIKQVVAFAGDPSSLLFGTDWPISDLGSYLRFVRNLGLSEEDNELILARNAIRIFKLDPESFASTASGADPNPATAG
jgi:predicted TIM-barrel fold metal-dependent hydrolase